MSSVLATGRTPAFVPAPLVYELAPKRARESRIVGAGVASGRLRRIFDCKGPTATVGVLGGLAFIAAVLALIVQGTASEEIKMTPSKSIDVFKRAFT